MSSEDSISVINRDEGRVYGCHLFAGHDPRSRVKREIIEEIQDEISRWPRDSRGVFVDAEGVIRHQSNYYFTARESGWQKSISPLDCEDEAEEKKPGMILRWWRQLVEALLEVDYSSQDWSLLKVEHLRLDEEENIRMLPPRTAENILLYSRDLRPPLPEECYRPPELMKREEGGDDPSSPEKVLVFNLGVIFYYLFTGDAPYQGRDRSETINRLKKGKMMPAKWLQPILGEELSDLLDACLQPDFEDRPFLSELLDRLEEMEEEGVLPDKGSGEEKKGVKGAGETRDKFRRQRKYFQYKQRISEMLRRKWPAVALIMVLAVGLPLIFFLGGPEEYVEPGHTPEEVAQMFYNAINEKNVNMLDDTGIIEFGELRRMVSESHVMETIQQFYEMEEFEDDVNTIEDQEEPPGETLFGVEDLDLELIEEEPPVIEADYTFFFQIDEEEEKRLAAQDTLFLGRRDERWQIMEVSGFIERLMRGDMPEIETENTGDKEENNVS